MSDRRREQRGRLGRAGLRFFVARAMDVVLPGAGLVMDMAEAASAAQVPAQLHRQHGLH